MRAVIQRCNWCRVSSEGTPVSSIGKGLSVLLGVKKGDTSKDVIYMADKIMHLRIFEDDNGKLNRSILDIGGEISIVSQFTLYGDVRRGRRPSFTEAELPEKARQLYQEVVDYFRNAGINVGTGEFQTYMKVSLENDGPVTILIDSEKIF